MLLCVLVMFVGRLLLEYVVVFVVVLVVLNVIVWVWSKLLVNSLSLVILLFVVMGMDRVVVVNWLVLL